MANDALVLRSTLLCLGAVVVLIGLYTHSFKKMFATYALGLCAIAGILLPDWEFFDRDFSQWLYPMTINTTDSSFQMSSTSTRSRVSPLRLILYTIVYGFGAYKWWMLVLNS